MRRLAPTAVIVLLALTACVRTETDEDPRVAQLQRRVHRLEQQVEALTGDATGIDGSQIVVPDDACDELAIAVWERDGTLGCIALGEEAITGSGTEFGGAVQFPTPFPCRVGDPVLWGKGALICGEFGPG